MVAVGISGILAGVYFALMGLGLAVVYRTSGVLNFAFGAVASCGAYVAWRAIDAGVPYWAAAIGALVVGGALGMAMEYTIVRRIPVKAYEAVSIATLGVALALQGILLALFGANSQALPAIGESQILVSVGGVGITTSDFISIGVLVLISVGMAFLLYRSRHGLWMRAASEGPVTAGMVGISVPAVRSWAWAISGSIAAVAGLVITPTNYLSPSFLTTFMVGAFAAIVLGGLDSLTGVVVGALAYGIISAFISYYATGTYMNTLALGVIVVVLALFPYGILGKKPTHVSELELKDRRVFARGRFRRRDYDHTLRPLRSTRVDAIPGRWMVARRLVGLGCGGGILLLLPLVVHGSGLFVPGATAAIFLAVFGLDIIYGYTGQISVGQSALMLVGGYTLYALVQHAHLGFTLAIAIAFVISAIAGAAVAFASLRLAGVYLVVLTLALALSVPELAQNFSGLTGGANGAFVPVPSFDGHSFNSDVGIYFYIVIVVLIFAGLTVAFLEVCGWRVRMGAVRDSPLAASAGGINNFLVRVVAFALGSGLAGVAGALSAAQTGYLSPDSFTIWTSIYLLAAVVVGGAVSPVGSLIGAAFITIVPYYSGNVAALPDVVLGLILCITIIAMPRGVVSLGNVVQTWTSNALANLRSGRE